RITPATISVSGSFANASSTAKRRQPERTPLKTVRVKARLGWIEAELRPAAFRVRLGFAAALLVGRLERAQAPDFLQNSLGIQLVLQALQRSVHRFTLTNDHFRHVNFLVSFVSKIAGFRTGAAEDKRAARSRQLL